MGQKCLDIIYKWNNGIICELKFTLCFNSKENFYKMIYHWYLSLEKYLKYRSDARNQGDTGS